MVQQRTNQQLIASNDWLLEDYCLNKSSELCAVEWPAVFLKLAVECDGWLVFPQPHHQSWSPEPSRSFSSLEHVESWVQKSLIVSSYSFGKMLPNILTVEKEEFSLRVLFMLTVGGRDAWVLTRLLTIIANEVPWKSSCTNLQSSHIAGTVCSVLCFPKNQEVIKN